MGHRCQLEMQRKVNKHTSCFVRQGKGVWGVCVCVGRGGGGGGGG